MLVAPQLSALPYPIERDRVRSLRPEIDPSIVTVYLRFPDEEKMMNRRQSDVSSSVAGHARHSTMTSRSSPLARHHNLDVLQLAETPTAVERTALVPCVAPKLLPEIVTKAVYPEAGDNSRCLGPRCRLTILVKCRRLLSCCTRSRSSRRSDSSIRCASIVILQHSRTTDLSCPPDWIATE